MDDKIKITFDNEYKIRVLEPTKFQKAEELEKECSSFVTKITSFNEKVNDLVKVLEEHAERIDSQKLRAIGLRMAVTSETEGRNRQKRALQTIINEKRAELDRINVQLQSLERIESEQKAMIERFTNSQS